MNKIIKVILVILWMSLIFWFSSQNAMESTNQSNSVIIKIASVFIDKNLSETKKEELIDNYSFYIRKLAHFTLYFILGLLVLNCVSEYEIKHLIILSLIICILYSISDEFHQSFIPGRSSELRDILIDSTGSYVGIITYYYIKMKLLLKIKK